MTKRLFLAVPLNREWQQAIKQWFDQPGRILSAWRPTSPDNLHLTLYFLGDIPTEKIPGLVAKLGQVFARQPAFDLIFDRIDQAPPDKPARMIWVYFQTNSDYQALVEKINAALGETVETARENLPHLTLARLKSDGLSRPGKLAGSKITTVNFPINRANLMASILTATGPVYQELASWPLEN